MIFRWCNVARPVQLALLCNLMALGLGCAPKVHFQGWVPSKLDVGPAKHLILVQSEGRRRAHEIVKEEIRRQSRITQYFDTEDKSDAVSMYIETKSAALDGEINEYAANDLFVRTDVLDWEAIQELRQRRVRDRRGRYQNETFPVYRGRVLLQITVVTGSGTVLLNKEDYEGTFEAETAPARLLDPGSHLTTEHNRDQTIRSAATIAVRNFLADITPISVNYEIRLDDSVHAHKRIFELAKDGRYAKAARAFEKILKHDPDSLVAMYNYAVMLDASGQHRESLPWYDKAIEAGGPDYYEEARLDAERRAEALEALR